MDTANTKSDWIRNDKGKYRTKKFPFVLSEMQTGNFDKCKGITYSCHQRARRTDAEPMNL